MSQEVRESIVLHNQGQKIFAVLHKPLCKQNSQQTLPVVIFCAGFAGNKSGKYRLYVRLSQELAKKGIASLRFDYRGSGDSEGELSDQTIESQVSDTLVCLSYLKSLSFVDKEKIGLFGRSLGGMIAILSTQNFTNLKSLALWAPVFTSRPWQRAMTQALNPLNESMQDILQMKPSSTFIDQFFKVDLNPLLKKLNTTPLLHIQSQKDQIVSKEHLDLYKRAREKHATSCFIELKDSNHEFSNSEEQQLILQETVNFYQETLFN